MIGTTLTEKGRKGATYRVVGQDGGHWVLDRLDTFESPTRAASADLVARFGAAEVEPQPASDELGWLALDEANREAMTADTPRQSTPEEILTAAEAKRLGHKR